MCKCVLQSQPSEGNWEHPSQPINTLKDTAGLEDREGNRTRFPLEAVGGEAETQGQCSKEAAETETTLKVCLQGAAPQGARLAMGQNGCSPL